MIERIKSPDIESFFQDYVRPCRPVIITDLAERWGALSKWSPLFFEETFGATEVSIRTLKTPNPTDPIIFMDSTYDRVSLAKYFSLTRRSDCARYYLCDLPLEKRFPSLMKDVGQFPYFVNWFHNLGLKNLLWIGPPGTIFPLHLDVNHNFHTQIYGKKRWRIWSPEHSSFFGIPSTLRKRNFSPRNLESQNTIEDMHKNNCQPIEFTLSPGETLFLPGRFLHFVETIEYSISINSWWNTILNRIRNLPADLRLSSTDILLDRHPPIP